MRRAPWCALLCCVAAPAAAQERAVTFEEPQPVSVTGFAVGRADYDRLARSNSFSAGKIGISLFKPVGDVYLFAQLTTALEGTETSTEIDNLLVSWTPQRANRWTLAFGRFDAPIGFEPRRGGVVHLHAGQLAGPRVGALHRLVAARHLGRGGQRVGRRGGQQPGQDGARTGPADPDPLGHRGRHGRVRTR